MITNRITRGQVAELLVATEATKRGVTVSLPMSHNSHYDLILDSNKLFRGQVKRVYEVNNHGTKTKCVESRRIKGNSRWKYPDGSYDFLIACDCETNDIWFIPFEVANKYKAQIYLGSKDEYKNQWSLLEADVSS